MRILRRLARILLAYLVSAFTASVAMALLTRFYNTSIWPDDIPEAIKIIFMMAYVIAVFAAVPALLVIVPAEVWRLRHWFIHTASGALVALIAFSVFIRGSTWLEVDGDTPVLIGSGLAAGLAYWAIAGRHAGNWQGTTSLATSSASSGS